MKIKITCTEEGKEKIQMLVENSPLCIFTTKMRNEICRTYHSCTKCTNENIEWEITEPSI